jgi:hypothetical protein
MREVSQWSDTFAFMYPNQVDRFLQPIFALCRDVLRLQSRCLPNIDAEPMNTNSNITGILKSLSRELNEVKNEIARINKTATKGNCTIGQDQVENDHRQASSAKSPPSTSNAPNKDASYASTAASKIKPQEQQPKQKAPSRLERLIICFQGDTIPSHQRPSPLQVTKMVNKRLSLMPTAKGLKVIGAQWNQTGNCILTFAANSAAPVIDDHVHVICNAMCHGKAVVGNCDVWWSRVVLHHVLTGISEHGKLLSADELLQELSTNKCVWKLKIMRKPDWIRKPEEIIGMHSLVSFAFQDPNGVTLKQLTKQPIFLFGELCTVKEWKDKPTISQCQHCWVYGHTTSSCRRKHAVCRLCGDLHREADH